MESDGGFSSHMEFGQSPRSYYAGAARIAPETSKFTITDEPFSPLSHDSDSADVQQQQPQRDVRQSHNANASDTTFCAAFGKRLYPVLCATVISCLYALPFLVVAAVKGEGTSFCLGYWQYPSTTSMPAELGGNVCCFYEQ